jgi:hypothetical protein
VAEIGCENKRIGAGIADEDFVASAAGDGVVKIRSCDAVDAGERVMADRAITSRRASREIDRNARCRATELDLRGPVTSNDVVATLALERVEADKAGGMVPALRSTVRHQDHCRTRSASAWSPQRDSLISQSANLNIKNEIA